MAWWWVMCCWYSVTVVMVAGGKTTWGRVRRRGGTEQVAAAVGEWAMVAVWLFRGLQGERCRASECQAGCGVLVWMSNGMAGEERQHGSATSIAQSLIKHPKPPLCPDLY